MIRSALIVLAVALTVSGQTRRPYTENIPLETRQARRLLNQAKAHSLRIKDSFQRDEILDKVGAAQAKAGDLEGAIDSASRVGIPATRTLDSIGEQLAESNDIARARVLGVKLKDGKPYSLLPGMARSLAKAKRFTQAIQTATEIQFAELRRYALEDIAVLQAANGDYAGARLTFTLATTAHPTGRAAKEELEDLIKLTEVVNYGSWPSQWQIDPRKPSEERVALILSVAEAFSKKGDRRRGTAWIQEALKEPQYDHFFRYFALPTLVKLGHLDDALQTAAKLSGELRVEGFMAIAVTCAEMKDAACAENATAKMQTALRPDEKSGGSDFGVKLMTLNVAAALIDNGQSEAALRLLAILGRDRTSSYEFGIASRAYQQRVLILAQRNRFIEALALAQKIEPDSMTDNHRGTALRMLALLQTKKSGTGVVRTWVQRLRKPEERAYALVGMAHALLNLEETKLGYAAITFH